MQCNPQASRSHSWKLYLKKGNSLLRTLGKIGAGGVRKIVRAEGSSKECWWQVIFYSIYLCIIQFHEFFHKSKHTNFSATFMQYWLLQNAGTAVSDCTCHGICDYQMASAIKSFCYEVMPKIWQQSHQIGPASCWSCFTATWLLFASLILRC